MHEIVPFEFGKTQVRVIWCGDHSEWIAKDVCEALELVGPPHQHLKNLDEDERGVTTIPTLGGPQEVATLTEAGLYRLVLQSRKAAAKLFKRWVIHEVLPSIRKKGFYVGKGAEEAALKELLAQTGPLVVQTVATAMAPLMAELGKQTQAIVQRFEQHDMALGMIGVQVKELLEWKNSTQREHPFGLMGKRESKVLRGQICCIRDDRILLGDKRQPLTVFNAVDKEIRKAVHYENTQKGSSWANATIEQGRLAFSEAAKLAEAARKDLAKMRKQEEQQEQKQGQPTQGKLFKDN